MCFLLIKLYARFSKGNILVLCKHKMKACPLTALLFSYNAPPEHAVPSYLSILCRAPSPVKHTEQNVVPRKSSPVAT